MIDYAAATAKGEDNNDEYLTKSLLWHSCSAHIEHPQPWVNVSDVDFLIS